MIELFFNIILLFTHYLRKIVSHYVFCPPNNPTYKIGKEYLDQTKKKVTRNFSLFSEKTKIFETPLVNSKIDFEIIKIPHYEYLLSNENNLKTESLFVGDSKKCNFFNALLFKPIDHQGLYIIYSHGNSCDIGVSFHDSEELALETKSVVISYEYEGYGVSKRKNISEEGVNKNIRSVYQYLNSFLKIDSNKIVLFGNSLGTGPTINLASQLKSPLAGIILQSPFLSCVKTVLDTNFNFWFDFFLNCDKIHMIDCQVLIIHGTSDSVVPITHSYRLIDKLKKGILFDFIQIKEGKHNDLFKFHSDLIYSSIRSFLKRVGNFKRLTKIKYNQLSLENYSFENNIGGNEEFKIIIQNSKLKSDTSDFDENKFERVKLDKIKQKT